MAADRHARRTDEPQHRRDRRGPESQRDRDTHESGIKLGGIQLGKPQVEIAAFQLSDPVETAGDQDDDEQQDGVCQQTVDAEHHKNHGIVAGKVAQVVVDTALGLTEVGGFGQTLEIQELRNRPEVGETRSEGLRADAVEPVAESRGERVEGDLDWTHCMGDEGVTRMRYVKSGSWVWLRGRGRGE